MEKFVSYEKCSKKERRSRDAARRGSWNGVNPVSRVVPSKKEYRRNPKHKGRDCPVLGVLPFIQAMDFGENLPYCSTAHPAGSRAAHKPIANKPRSEFPRYLECKSRNSLGQLSNMRPCLQAQRVLPKRSSPALLHKYCW